MGVYGRKPLPDQSLIWIPRVRCKQCLATHAVLPAFLFGYARYTTATLSVYFEQAIESSRRPIETWSEDLADGPQSFETLYRWLRRLRERLGALLPRLQQELLTLDPAFDFSPLEKFILKSPKSPSREADQDRSAQSQPAAVTSPPAMLSIVALCAISYWLGQNVLQLAGELLQAEAVLSPVAFLNYFCWQKLEVALISPHPKPRAP